MIDVDWLGNRSHSHFGGRNTRFPVHVPISPLMTRCGCIPVVSLESEHKTRSDSPPAPPNVVPVGLTLALLLLPSLCRGKFQGLTLNSASVVVFADPGWQVVVKRLAHCSLGKSEGQFAGKYGICMDICCSSYFSLDMWSACAFDST